MPAIRKTFPLRGEDSAQDVLHLFQRLISFGLIAGIVASALLLWWILPPMLFAPLMVIPVVAVVFIRGCRQQEWAHSLAHWWLKPTDGAWMATFDVAFTLEYRRWREFVSSGDPSASEFRRIKDELELMWPQLKPASRDDLDRKAMAEVRTAKQRSDFPAGTKMHILYRNWEVSQSTDTVVLQVVPSR